MTKFHSLTEPHLASAARERIVDHVMMLDRSQSGTELFAALGTS